MDLSDAVRVGIGRAMGAYAVVAGLAGIVLFVWFGLAELLLREWVAHNAVPAVAVGVLVWFIVSHQPRNGVALLRYRLYEIDRVISRTVAYGSLVVVLGAVYAVAVVGTGAVVSGVTDGEGSDVVVTVSVLAVVALFRPVRARVQRAVDRRFNRSAYDARRAVDACGGRLRDGVDPDTIRRELAVTAATVVAPDRLSVWITGASHEPRSGEDGP